MFNVMDIEIIKASIFDAQQLTYISFAAKKHWNYTDHYYELWKDELTITSDYISNNIVCKAQYQGNTLGFYSIIENKSDLQNGKVFVGKGFWMEHIFILPDYHHMGIGRLLTNHALKIAKANCINKLLIFVDPYAEGFYQKMGAKYLYESKSSIPSRLIPVYELRVQLV